MNPRRLSPAVLHKRLDTMARLLNELDQHHDVQAADLEADLMLRSAIERLIQAIVDLSIDINGHLRSSNNEVPPASGRDSFRALNPLDGTAQSRATLEDGVGLRNILVHAYTDVSLELLAQAVPTLVAEYRIYHATVAQWLRSQGETTAH